MGAKFYRGSDKSKKIRKRLSQTRTWFKQFKWIACKYHHLDIADRFNKPIKAHWWWHSLLTLLFLLTTRSRASNLGLWPSFQGKQLWLHRSAFAPRHEALPDQHSYALQPVQPSQGCWCRCCRLHCSLFRFILLRLLRWIHLQDVRQQMRKDVGEHEEVLRDQLKPQWRPPSLLRLLHRRLQKNGLQLVNDYQSNLTAIK